MTNDFKRDLARVINAHGVDVYFGASDIELADYLAGNLDNLGTLIGKRDINLLGKLGHRLEKIEGLLINNSKKEDQIMTDLTGLTQAVNDSVTVEESAITLLNGLKTALDQAGTDPAALKALSDQLGAEKDKLAAAITANTPAA